MAVAWLGKRAIRQGGLDLPGATAGCELAPLLPTRILRTLADPNRVAILASLAKGGKHKTVREVARCCPVDLAVVSPHLASLREAGIVEADDKRRGAY